MKKVKLLSLMLIATLFLAACGGADNDNAALENTGVNAEGSTGGNAAMNDVEDMGDAGDVNAAADTDEASAPAVDLGACQNIYYPIVEGPVYTYSIVSDFETVEQTITFTGVSPDGFVSVMDVEEIHSEIFWDCSAAGMVSADYAQFNLFAGADVTVETIDVGGVVIPAEENMVVGYEWDSTFTMRATMNIEGMTAISDVVVEQHLEIVGKEAVSVPAGEYPEALLVQMTADMTVNISIDGSEATTVASNFTGTAYYVANVGLVKQTGTFEGYSTLMELISLD